MRGKVSAGNCSASAGNSLPVAMSRTWSRWSLSSTTRNFAPGDGFSDRQSAPGPVDCRSRVQQRSSFPVATPKHVVLWETVSGKERGRFPASGGVPAFSPDGRLLAVGGPDAVRVWDVCGGKELARLEGHAGAVLWVTFTPDGRRLLTAGADSTALVWDADRLSRLMDR